MSDDATRIPLQTLFQLRKGADVSQEAQARYEIERRQSYRILFGSPLGRYVLADMLMSFGFFTPDPPMPADELMHRAGARWAASEVLRAMGADNPDVLTRVVLNDDVGEVFDEDETA